MGKKSKHKFDYFDCLSKMSRLAVKAARQLDSITEDYSDLTVKAEKLHNIEHEADELLHNMIFELSRSFITPIDREDIMVIGSNLDDVIDQIEDISSMLDMYSITSIREPAKQMTDLIVKACSSLEKAMKEFKNFKKSGKELTKLIIEVNKCEEEADTFYRKTIKSLYKSESNPIELAKWKEIYDTMENTLDSCEDVANLLEVMSIKNS